jgi:putative endonuclease
MANKRQIGKLGEEIAKKYLENQGITIIFQNYFTKWGEIDLIGLEKKTIIFIEVKLRNSTSFGEPIESINHDKINKLKLAIDSFFLKEGYNDYDCRFDVVCILYNKLLGGYETKWLKNQYFN